MLPKQKNTRDIFMGKLSMELYLKNLSKRYKAASKHEKGKILQELSFIMVKDPPFITLKDPL